MDLKNFTFPVIWLIILLNYSPLALSCPEMQCAPIISKCQLLDSCRCEAKLNYTCFKECFHCLGDLYPDCCSCVGICPPDDKSDSSPESHVKLFETSNEDLYDLFTNYGEPSDRWQVYNQTLNQSNSTQPVNCTMTYLADCLNMYQCESACISIGASGFRWFHPIGCCECVGKHCLTFGINQIRCRNCPEESDLVDSSPRDL